MTLLNAWISRERALVGIDTLSKLVGSNDEPHEASKLFLIPHSGIVIAGRGYLAFTVLVHNSLTQSVGDVHLDWALGVMPDLLPQLVNRALQLYPPEPGDPFAFGPQELLIVGWSRENQSMQGVVFRQEKAESGFLRQEIAEHYVAPWEVREQGPIPLPDTPAAMEFVARAQVRFGRSRWPGMPLGGRLVLAEVTRHEARMRSDIVLLR